VPAAKSAKNTTDTNSVTRILAAAEQLFAEQGFAAVSMSAIALKANVSKANIFHHFTSKNSLYLAVLRSVSKESLAKRDLRIHQNDTFVDRLSHFANDHLQTILEHSNMARLVLRDLLQYGPERGKELAEQVIGPNFTRLVEIIREGQAQAQLRNDLDPAMVAMVLIAANVYFFEMHDVLRHLPAVDFADDPHRYSTMMMQLILNGILPRETQA
jgi:TetR/AcrR family transcriptional regulator